MMKDQMVVYSLSGRERSRAVLQSGIPLIAGAALAVPLVRDGDLIFAGLWVGFILAMTGWRVRRIFGWTATSAEGILWTALFGTRALPWNRITAMAERTYSSGYGSSRSLELTLTDRRRHRNLLLPSSFGGGDEFEVQVHQIHQRWARAVGSAATPLAIRSLHPMSGFSNWRSRHSN